MSSASEAISFSTRAFSASISAKSFSASRPPSASASSHPIASSDVPSKVFSLFSLFSFGYLVSCGATGGEPFQHRLRKPQVSLS